jgi:hypothetical protein
MLGGCSCSHDSWCWCHCEHPVRVHILVPSAQWTEMPGQTWESHHEGDSVLPACPETSASQKESATARWKNSQGPVLVAQGVSGSQGRVSPRSGT